MEIGSEHSHLFILVECLYMFLYIIFSEITTIAQNICFYRLLSFSLLFLNISMSHRKTVENLCCQELSGNMSPQLIKISACVATNTTKKCPSVLWKSRPVVSYLKMLKFCLEILLATIPSSSDTQVHSYTPELNIQPKQQTKCWLSVNCKKKRNWRSLFLVLMSFDIIGLPVKKYQSCCYNNM